MSRLAKGLSLFIVLIVYIAAFFAGLLVYRLTAQNALLAFFLADAAATVIVWIFGLVYHNASMYDPYWSVAPIVLLIAFIAASGKIDDVDILLLTVIVVWGVRLTLNWAIGWPDMKSQDWRYSMLKQKRPGLWPLTNFFGISMMPTLIVFAALVPAYLVTQSFYAINALTVIGAVICLGAAVLQLVSDAQMRRFRKDQHNRGRFIEAGCWRFSRHPNYFGEISFWWGIFIIQMSVAPSFWWTVFAPCLMTLLFVFISVPMMEKRLLASKDGYDLYRRRTSMLIPLPKKRV